MPSHLKLAPSECVMSQEVLSTTNKPKVLPASKSTKCERRAIRNSALGRARRWISLLETKIFRTRRSWIRSNARLTHEWSYQPATSYTLKSCYPYSSSTGTENHNPLKLESC